MFTPDPGAWMVIETKTVTGVRRAELVMITPASRDPVASDSVYVAALNPMMGSGREKIHL